MVQENPMHFYLEPHHVCRVYRQRNQHVDCPQLELDQQCPGGFTQGCGGRWMPPQPTYDGQQLNLDGPTTDLLPYKRDCYKGVVERVIC